MKFFTPLCYFILGTCFLLISLSSNSQSFSHPSAGTVITGDVMHAASGSDFIGVVYSRSGNIYYNQINSESVWGEEELLGTGSTARLAIDSSDRPHVVFTATATPAKIAYLKYDGSNWSEVVYIESNNGGACSKPDIAVDGNGFAHITYTDTQGNTHWYRNKPDILYATNNAGSFSKSIIFDGFYESLGGADYYGNYFDKGSFISLDSNENYFIAAHQYIYSKNMSYIDRYYSVVIKSNLGTGSTSSASTDGFAIYDLDFNGTSVLALYKQTTFKTSELTVAGTTINFSNSQAVSVAETVSSVAGNNTNLVVGGKNSTNLFTQFNDLGHVYTDVAVKNMVVSSVEVGDVFYTVYSDNVDGKIKIREVAEPLSISRFEVPGQDGPTVIDGQAATVDIKVAGGTNLTSLVATYSTTSDVNGVTVETIPQTSAVTANDFSETLTYALSDGINSRNWMVSVRTGIQDTVEVDICEGETYTFGMQDYSETGNYIETFTASNGSDSTVLLVLTVNQNYTFSEALTLCMNELPYLFGSQTLTTSGVYTEVFPTVNGCDSTVTLTLTVNPGYNSQMLSPEHIIAHYTFNGNADDISGNLHHGTVFEATPVSDRFGNPTGAYSFDGVNDYIDLGDWENGGAMSFVFWARWDKFNNYSRIIDLGNGASSDNIVVSNRQTNENLLFSVYKGSSETQLYTNTISLNQWDFYAVTVDESGLMTLYKNGGQIAQKTDGVTPNFLLRTKQFIGKSNFSQDGYFEGAIDELIVYNTSLSSSQVQQIFNNTALSLPRENLEICASELPYSFGMQQLYESGTYTETFQTVYGCDSVVTLNMVVNPVYEKLEEAIICDGESYSFDRQTYTEPGEYLHTFSTVQGCDSLVTLKLTVNPVYNHTYEAVICQGDTYVFGTQNLTEAGEYTEVFPSATGCDSTVVLALTINPEYNHTDEVAICQGETYVFGTQNLTAAGEYTEVFPSATGCDSTVVLTLTVKPVYNHTDEAAICQGDTYVFGTQNLTAAGEYTEVFPSASGCDSTVVLTLTVKPVYNHTDEAAICQGDTYVFGTQNLTAAGEYTEVFPSATGCDSAVVLTLTVNPVYNHTEEVAICKGEAYAFGGQNLTAAGEYTYLFQSATGCDSTVVLTLTVNPVYNHTDEAVICQGDTYVFGAQTLTDAGEYTELFISATGCDSTVVLTLTVHPVFNETTAATVYADDLPVIFGNQTLTEGGTYTETFSSVNGCDSTITLTLTVKPADITPPVLVISPIAISLNSSGQYTLTTTDIQQLTEGTSDDNTAYPDIAFTTVPNSFTCTQAGTAVPVTVTATDLRGNSSSVAAIVNVTDQTPPEIVCRNVNLQLDEYGQVTIDESRLYSVADDACGIISVTAEKTLFDCNDVGTLNVQLTATDMHNNTNTCTATVTISDLLPPLITPVETQVINLEEGSCETTVEYPALRTTDNCSVKEIYQIEGLGPDATFTAGISTEQWVAVDESGNSDTISFEIHVMDNTAAPSMNSIAEIELEEDDPDFTFLLDDLSDGSPCLNYQLEFTLTPDNPDLLLSVEFTHQPGEDSAQLHLVPVQDATGETSAIITVSNAETGKQYSDTFNIRILPVNDPPRAVRPLDNLEIRVDETYKLYFSPYIGVLFDDVDDDHLQLTLTADGGEDLPGWLSFSSDTLEAYPAAGDAGCVNLMLTATDAAGAIADAPFMICVSPAVSAEELIAGKISAYPNPTSGKLYIEPAKLQNPVTGLEICNSLGKVILQRKVTDTVRMEIDLSNYTSGIYILKATGRNFFFTQKIVLKAK